MLINHKNNQASRGFTLIELLVVIAIIGILAGMVLVSMGGARAKARDAKRQSDMRQLVTAQQMYTGDNVAGAHYQFAGANMPTAISTYLVSVPVDPTNTTGGVCPLTAAVATTYRYCQLANNAAADADKFCYYARLEQPISGKGYVAASQAGITLKTTIPTALFGTTAASCTTGL